MAFRLYILPLVADATKYPPGGRWPKYIKDLSVSWAGMDYGHNPTMMVAADLLPAQDTALVANADVFAFPFNLDTAITGGAINSTRSALEAFFIPAQDIESTYRLQARVVGGLFQYMGRLAFVIAQRTGQNQVVIDTAEKLNIQFSSLPVENQGDLLSAAASLNIDTSFITGTTQLRAILRTFANFWGSKQFQLNTFTF
jgi:hypothetical protein